jgi:5-methylcytosine-specific restriction enzyme subunit McrC
VTTLTFREHQRKALVDLFPRQLEVLRDRFGCDVWPSIQDTTRFDVRPGNVVGVANVDGTTIHVEPKLPISRILFLLAHMSTHTPWDDESANLAEIEDLSTAVASLFCHLCRAALRTGPLSDYRVVTDTLPAPRGRIDIAENIKRRQGRSIPLCVTYQDYDTNVALNQILLAALLALAELPSCRAADNEHRGQGRSVPPEPHAQRRDPMA